MPYSSLPCCFPCTSELLKSRILIKRPVPPNSILTTNFHAVFCGIAQSHTAISPNIPIAVNNLISLFLVCFDSFPISAPVPFRISEHYFSFSSFNTFASGFKYSLFGFLPPCVFFLINPSPFCSSNSSNSRIAFLSLQWSRFIISWIGNSI